MALVVVLKQELSPRAEIFILKQKMLLVHEPEKHQPIVEMHTKVCRQVCDTVSTAHLSPLDFKKNKHLFPHLLNNVLIVCRRSDNMKIR